MAAERRSGRARKPNARYTTDAFANLEIDLGSDADDAATVPPNIPDDDSEDEFDAAKDAAEQAGEEAEDNLSMDEGSDAEASEDDDPDAEGEEEDDDYEGEVAPATAAGFPYMARAPKGPRPIAPRSGPKMAPSARLRQRQLEKEWHKGGLENRLDNYVGKDYQDLYPARQAHTRWFPQPTLPTRVQDKKKFGGMGYSPWFNDEAVKQEKSKVWLWYDTGGGKAAFLKNQAYNILTPQEAESYLPIPYDNSQSFLAGPPTNPVLCSLELRQSKSLSDLWTQSGSGDRHGWILNVGRRVQKVQWVPNRVDGPQYLCVNLYHHEYKANAAESTRGNPFQPTKPTKDCLQIWEIDAAPIDTEVGSVRSSRAPRLAYMLCTDWGDLRDFEWCPVPWDRRDNGHSLHLGLVAGIWGDGSLRVLDVRMPQSSSMQMISMRITSTSFEFKPSDTVGTCLAWLSSSAVALACANGSVMIFSIAENLRAGRMSEPRPFFYHAIHQSYITCIASGYPSNAYTIATGSMDGFFVFTDVRSPFQDSTYPQRARAATTTVKWQDHSQGWLAPDDHCLLRMHGARRAFSSVYAGRADSSVITVASSPLHTSVLYGSLDGAVQAVNPLRRLMEPRSLTWIQTWFSHEWRAGKTAEDGAGTQNSALSKPLTRFVEGYKALQVEMNRADKSNIGKTKVDQEQLRVFFAMYEERTAVTALAWNHNMRYGGWAAAGMGTGLVRVEDIAI